MNNSDFDTLIAPMQQRMTNAIWRVVRDADATEDVLQEVLMRVISKIKNVRRHPNPQALLLKMCVNAGIDHVRRARGNRRTASTGALPEALGKGADPSVACAQNETRSRIIAAIAGLPRREAEAMTLLAVEGMNTSDVACAMKCKESTIRVLIARARKRLRTKLMPLEIGGEQR